MERSENLVWIDLEMTGLDPDTCHIIEIATIVTDKELNILAEGPNLAVHQPKSVMDLMDEWCTKTHGESGLTERVLNSDISMDEAERQTLKFLAEWVEPGKSPLCGNSVWQDRRFLYKEMPELERFCHYRIIDVSTLKELARRWKPNIISGHTKKGTHLALDDIRESIDELKYFKAHLLNLD
ncbi:oligoribonuclease [Gynuella sunshinyii]|uniref:Oligoribonuclease n=1 Tax=Gynuella sunshinyii YC6258 TaxID=1445510 RepID=A0A0C5V4H9_9GAMM|nr:oligoribonuclease [Gynuella sunshinyii]AJQ94385.1 oligoribonuclease (3'->5' exoribonuclease) [Gynuella sunshinyii YC6258]